MQTKTELRAENEVLRAAIRDVWWMARRYSDGRSSYATSQYNDHTRALLARGVLPPDWFAPDGTPWARDGMGHRLAGLTPEEHALGGPLEAWQARANAEQVAAIEARLGAVLAAACDWQRAYCALHETAWATDNPTDPIYLDAVVALHRAEEAIMAALAAPTTPPPGPTRAELRAACRWVTERAGPDDPLGSASNHKYALFAAVEGFLAARGEGGED